MPIAIDLRRIYKGGARQQPQRPHIESWGQPQIPQLDRNIQGPGGYPPQQLSQPTQQPLSQQFQQTQQPMQPQQYEQAVQAEANRIQPMQVQQPIQQQPTQSFQPMKQATQFNQNNSLASRYGINRQATRKNTWQSLLNRNNSTF